MKPKTVIDQLQLLQDILNHVWVSPGVHSIEVAEAFRNRHADARALVSAMKSVDWIWGPDDKHEPGEFEHITITERGRRAWSDLGEPSTRVLFADWMKESTSTKPTGARSVEALATIIHGGSTA